ncbi:MAG: hypothetical protein J7502_07685, partial [Flavisolibacter sp.]|nr:hypothetical protein [Flavisolibacter sp.]
MKAKVFLSIVILQIMLFSCSRKYYYKYFDKRIKEVTLKYDPKAVVKTKWNKTPDTSKPSKRKIEEVIAGIEKRNALAPDSIFVTQYLGLNDKGQLISKAPQKWDSFYFRKEKIEYIKKHDLVTPTKHFI